MDLFLGPQGNEIVLVEQRRTRSDKAHVPLQTFSVKIN
jgi:hypothetical protein